MIYEIKARINGILNDQHSYLTTFDYAPQQIDDVVPCAILYTQAVTSERKSASEVLYTVPVNVLVYLHTIGMSLTSRAEFEIQKVADDLFATFHARPKLQLNDRGLGYLQNSIDVNLIRDLQPMNYPLNYSTAPAYFGLQIEIRVQYRLQHVIAVNG